MILQFIFFTMRFNFDDLAREMPAGMLITDTQLEVLYMNAYARDKIFDLMPGQERASVLLRSKFYTTDRQVFDMHGCMQNMISMKKRTFHKTLIIRKKNGDSLLFFTARAFGVEGLEHYVFVLVDISDEMDCITHAPHSFGREEFELRSRIIGHDEKIRHIYRLINLAADSNVNVLVTGESGTGKELVADAIHALSKRRDKPIVKVNCAALSESLLESELFGHVKGAFTGAVKDKTGKFEEADGGTLFLDEIGEISQSTQVKLLRVIQEKTIERVGDNKPIAVDMRIIAATNRDLPESIKHGSFREDLYYRLNVFSIRMPALRERMLDIPRLADHFIDKGNENTGKQVRGISKEAMRLMMRYRWPGNIRELQNAIEHAFVLVQNNLIEPEDLPESVRLETPSTASANVGGPAIQERSEPGLVKSRGRLNISREQLSEVLEKHNWNQSETARFLGISRVALWKKIKKFDL